MRIHQLNLKYDNDQDRVVARICSTTGVEIRLWLTRRLTVGFLPLLRKLTLEQAARADSANASAGTGLAAQDPKIRELLSEFKRDAALQASDFSTPYKEPPPAATPLEDFILVREIALTPLANAHLQVKFSGKSASSSQKQEVKIDLDDRLMHGFLHLLEKCYVTSQWAQSAVAQAEADSLGQAGSGNGAGVGVKRPQYLN